MASLAAERPKRPYPGLRPFEADEWSIFFGRERMIDEVIERLGRDRLIVIHGASGSGKSSLVRAGVMPKLARQHLRHGAPWLTCAMRPSGGPLWNLASEFTALEGQGEDLDRIEAINGKLSRRGATLASVAGQLEGLQGKSLCVLIDQFEELFRYEKETSRDEAEVFVDLISRAIGDAAAGANTGVHVIVTMRSEFLGDCARFEGLAETLNRTQYLVPRMDDEAISRAVRRPALMFNGQVDDAAASRLIASVRGREDELPLLQHGLMMMWDRASQGPAGARIAVDDTLVVEAGGLAELLSRHADEVMAAAAPDNTRARLVESLFRELTDVNSEGSAIRRPRALRDLAAVAGSSTEDLRYLIDAFRGPGVSFLTPYAPKPLTETTIVDISHEALIRCWRRIADKGEGWLKAEFDDGLAWRSLVGEARAFEKDRAHMLSPAATQDRTRLTRVRSEPWSARYGGGWPQVQALLAASRRAAQRARLFNLSAVAALALLTIGASAAAWYSFSQSRLAVEARNEALAQKASAEAAARAAQEAKAESLAEKSHAEEAARKADAERDKAVAERDRADFNDQLGRMFVDAVSDIGVLTKNDFESTKQETLGKLRKIAEQGNDVATEMMGAMYYRGLGVTADFAVAFNWYAKAAANGNTTAARNLGIMYSNGQGVQQDYSAARQWLEQAAAKDDATADYYLGIIYRSGSGVARDYKIAREWFLKGAARNSAVCMNLLGIMSFRGEGGDRDYAVARYWYEKAANVGESYAIGNLGGLYDYGLGVDQNFARARELYEKAAAAGNAIAMNDLGYMLETGRGSDRDPKSARAWYEKAADAGNTSAMLNLGRMYENGIGVDRNYSDARQWYEDAARDNNAVGMRAVGLMYANGKGVVPDDAKAREWLEKAFAAGDGYAAAELGWMTYAARGARKDLAKVRDWFEKGVTLNDTYAMRSLGILRFQGLGARMDCASAARWMEKAAAGGDVFATHLLGFFYRRGCGVARDPAKASILYQKAASVGLATSMRGLGILYETGAGVPLDLDKSREWYEKAVAAGDVDAKKFLTALPYAARRNEVRASGDAAIARTLQIALARDIEADETAREGKAGELTALALRELSWRALLAKDCQLALDSAERAAAISPSFSSIALARAHALLCLGRDDDAFGVYSAHKDEVMYDREGLSWQRAVSDDFNDLRAIGLFYPTMTKIEASLAYP